MLKVGVKQPESVEEPEGDEQQQDLGFDVAVLKLYDRRFSAQLRHDHGVDPWSENDESAYKAFIDSGAAEGFAERLERGEFGDTAAWSISENETYLQVLAKNMFEAESSVYTALHNYQGKEIPRLIAPITIDTAPSSHASPIEESAGSAGTSYSPSSTQELPREFKELTHVKGLLLEYVPGVKFSKFEPETIPKSAWQDLVDQAIRTVNILGDHNILNEDVRPDNLLAVQDASAGCGYRAVMIDFGCSRLREEGESDFDWGRAKQREDEDGAVGAVMYTRLASQYDFELKYEFSSRWDEYAETEEERNETTRTQRLQEWLDGFASY